MRSIIRGRPAYPPKARCRTTGSPASATPRSMRWCARRWWRIPTCGGGRAHAPGGRTTRAGARTAVSLGGRCRHRRYQGIRRRRRSELRAAGHRRGGLLGARSVGPRALRAQCRRRRQRLGAGRLRIRAPVHRRERGTRVVHGHPVVRAGQAHHADGRSLRTSSRGSPRIANGSVRAATWTRPWHAPMRTTSRTRWRRPNTRATRRCVRSNCCWDVTPAAEIATRTDFVAMPPAPPVGVPLAMLERRPDVIAAERRVAAAFNRIGEAKAAHAAADHAEPELRRLRE